MSVVNVDIEHSWGLVLAEEFSKPYFKELTDFVKREYSVQKCHPKGREIFRAFELCPFDKVKVVILGQDPYHGPRQAHGLCFSVNKEVDIPASLKNIYQELATDVGVRPHGHGDLSRWSRQGVLLLNATLTVRSGQAGSHQGKGWEQFTDAVIKALNDYRKGLVFILWGSYAQKKGFVIDGEKHLKLMAPHPSPLSAYRGFFGSRPFSQTNEYLKNQGVKEIDWA